LRLVVEVSRSSIWSTLASDRRRCSSPEAIAGAAAIDRVADHIGLLVAQHLPDDLPNRQPE
jgi:hypothetical protein